MIAKPFKFYAQRIDSIEKHAALQQRIKLCSFILLATVRTRSMYPATTKQELFKKHFLVKQ